ncbi:cobyrinate a,c-diamide synthase [Vibrio sp. Of7-15]|uniref:cobyrinate a,c-diamide synthase n=1 Tax=Vibrio sp. Of7-15 TaxID=2724879 RepID=UPI001EF338A9|nr:cobyrinate a,c-diamide synthase [Vibrio sp. Of7-15]MCG7499326.1 cobyrinate a,c-diamide synthase [Vibrio sp. Of7-15]
MTTLFCPALILAAPASGQGKTTITAALASMLRRQGKVVRVFKVGPDYLDPQILSQASAQPVEQLDLWMAGEAYCQNKMYEAAKVADIILVEGAMGIFDGQPSSADLAARFGIPIAIVMDVKGMAQTAAAIAMGLANYRDDFKTAGLIANNCGSERHAQLIKEALPDSLPLLGTLKRTPEISLPERHLGLVQAQEIREELETRLSAGADWVETSDLSKLLNKLEPVAFHQPDPKLLAVVPSVLTGKVIAVAKDDAFSFIYDANLRLLEELGASYQFFSPLHDEVIPKADALWLPGGYPELHVEALANNTSMLTSIRAFFANDKPVLAECGGFLYCLESLSNLEDQQYKMLGLMQGHGKMRTRGGCQGMQAAVLPEGDVRAHSHHRSVSIETPEPIAHGRRQRHPAPGEAIYRVGSLTASYLHLFFPSNPEAVGQLFLSATLDANLITNQNNK